jgi:hypothetical protein
VEIFYYFRVELRKNTIISSSFEKAILLRDFDIFSRNKAALSRDSDNLSRNNWGSFLNKECFLKNLGKNHYFVPLKAAIKLNFLKTPEILKKCAIRYEY